MTKRVLLRLGVIKGILASQMELVLMSLLRVCEPSPGQVLLYNSVSQPPGRGPVPGPGINYTGPREILLQLITNLNVILYLSTCHTVHIIVLTLFMIMQ